MSNQQDITKFEFLLSLENNIVCQRFFNVKDHVIESKNSISSFGFELKEEDKDKYTYPINGWYYFETREEALEKLNIVESNEIVTRNKLLDFNIS